MRLRATGEFLDIEVLVSKEDLVVVVGSISVRVGMELDIKACRSLSWVIRLVRMLLVLCSKTCWYLNTSLG